MRALDSGQPCGHHGCLPPAPGSLVTVPTVITASRTLVCLALAAVAVGYGVPTLLFIGLGVYWVGDVIDGLVARRFGWETRSGAVLDILCDRLCAAPVFLALARVHPEILLPVVIFLAQFVVVDCYLSLAVLRWPLLSPNYFHLVDRRIHLWNWSPVAKAANSAAVVLLALVAGAVPEATTLAMAIGVLKLLSIVRLRRLGSPPSGTWCAAAKWAVPAADDVGSL